MIRRLLQLFASLRTAAFLAAVVALGVATIAVWWGALNQDEGWYLYAAQLVQAGKTPYRDFFFTQGPTMPYVYSVFASVWQSWASPLHGLLGARILTGLFGLGATGFAILLVRRLVSERHRAAATLTVFALLACNLYHVYFTTIPKTYALGSLFVLAGFWLLARGLQEGQPLALVLSGLSFAWATGTRISLLLVLPVVGFGLLFLVRRHGAAFFWFGLGGAAGLLSTYGYFAWNPETRAGLLAAQQYHAARGGFDPFFAVGSVSRLVRGYAALGGVLIATLVAKAASAGVLETAGGDGNAGATERGAKTVWALLIPSFFAVFLLQLSAPFPYDDYQVPIMGLLTVAVAVPFVRAVPKAGVFAVLLAGLVSFASPQLQEWATYGQDRFWSVKKEMTELAKLRKMAREINFIDPNGTDLLTQDLYLAVEAGRSVPSGFEMGPFSYFAELTPQEAEARHVLSREGLEKILASAPTRMAAFSGYGFAISVPKTTETPFEDQKRFWEILKAHYELVDTEKHFGQNATTLLILKRREKEGPAS